MEKIASETDSTWGFHRVKDKLTLVKFPKGHPPQKEIGQHIDHHLRNHSMWHDCLLLLNLDLPQKFTNPLLASI